MYTFWKSNLTLKQVFNVIITLDHKTKFERELAFFFFINNIFFMSLEIPGIKTNFFLLFVM